MLEKLEKEREVFSFYQDISEIRKNIFLGSLSGLNNESDVK